MNATNARTAETVPASDLESSAAPARVVWPAKRVAHLTATTLRLGHGPRWVDSNQIGCGADF